MKLEDKTALVTAGSGALSSAVTRRLAKRGIDDAGSYCGKQDAATRIW